MCEQMEVEDLNEASFAVYKQDFLQLCKFGLMV